MAEYMAEAAYLAVRSISERLRPLPEYSAI